MSIMEDDLKTEIEGIEYELNIAKSNIPDFAGRHFNGNRENCLIFCLERAADLTEACLILKDRNLTSSIAVLARAIFDCVLWTCWIVKSEENAQKFSEYANQQSLRVMKKNLQHGFGKIIDKRTQRNVTNEFLLTPLMTSIPAGLKVEEIACDVGLEKLQTQIYGLLAMEGHGSTYNLWENVSKDERILANLALINVLIECVNLVVINWIVHRKQTPITEIRLILR